ncbi:hypothetical protein PBY51_020127 [Eleginops maclovinus]|uniref:Uncharacterized protein n=1 Tax=Eleginops maclovinus TaxID=56733 RepID=A0AAN7XSN0_ELEMC|nr:hypothetical protein PBY51_020127 [Eleginops maclovinus]
MNVTSLPLSIPFDHEELLAECRIHVLSHQTHNSVGMVSGCAVDSRGRCSDLHYSRNQPGSQMEQHLRETNSSVYLNKARKAWEQPGPFGASTTWAMLVSAPPGIQSR